MALIFYDTETSGTNICFDQILQLAAIKTDSELNLIDRFNIECRLLPHIVPAPSALMATGMSASDIVDRPLSHFDMARTIYAKFGDWSRKGTIFLGWNSMRFDEIMLRQAYYQTLHPVFQTQSGGNGRADLMRIAQMVAVLEPTAFTWPKDSEGNASFTLEQFARANSITHKRSHEAMADTETTLAIAKLIKKRSPELWRNALANTPIAPSKEFSNEWALFDLQFDPAAFLNGEDDFVL